MKFFKNLFKKQLTREEYKQKMRRERATLNFIEAVIEQEFCVSSNSDCARISEIIDRFFYQFKTAYVTPDIIEKVGDRVFEWHMDHEETDHAFKVLSLLPKKISYKDVSDGKFDRKWKGELYMMGNALVAFSHITTGWNPATDH